MNEREIILAGGNVNSEVVRIGDTVRRAMNSNSPTVHNFLGHLRHVGFDRCPQVLGVDDDGREILQYINGDAGLCDEIWQGTEPLVATANLVQQFHDASAQYAHRGDDNWAFNYPEPDRHEVICHNDFAPYNFIFTNGVPTSVIDFDLAGPGPRIRDIAYAAYWMTPLSFQSGQMKSLAMDDLRKKNRRLKLFCETYGIEPNQELLAMIIEVLTHMSDKYAAMGMIGEEAAIRLESGGHFEHWRRETQAFKQQQHLIERNLIL